MPAKILIMAPETLTSILLFFVLIILVFFYLIRIFSSLHKKKLNSKSKDSTQVGFVVETFHDLVSKLKDKERELEILKRNAEERASRIEIYNENIFQSVPSGVVGFDQDFRITKINSAAEKILGLRESEVIGKKNNDIFNSPITEIIENRKIVERAEVGYVTHAGKRIWLGLTISPLKDSSGSTIGQILVFTDLTDLKALQSQMELRERLSTLGEMSAGIAHELRNPMGVISGYTKILSKKADDALMPAVEAINKEIAVMDRIITDFLSFAKPTELILSNVDLNELISGCIKAIQNISDRIDLKLNVDKMPVIKGDEVLLRQSIANLLQNAVESMPEGGDLNLNGSVKDYLYISISDTGHGIPENIKDKIFLPFYTTKERGTGLGLSIVHKIIVAHGGTIQVESCEKGTSFTIRLPKEIIVDNPS
ncbi:MAG: ATP-binding protein [Nitrospirota bacterium]